MYRARALIADPARTARVRTEARRSVENLTWERIMEHMEQQFREVLRTKGAKHVQAEVSPAAD